MKQTIITALISSRGMMGTVALSVVEAATHKPLLIRLPQGRLCKWYTVCCIQWKLA